MERDQWALLHSTRQPTWMASKCHQPGLQQKHTKGINLKLEVKGTFLESEESCLSLPQALYPHLSYHQISAAAQSTNNSSWGEWGQWGLRRLDEVWGKPLARTGRGPWPIGWGSGSLKRPAVCWQSHQNFVHWGKRGGASPWCPPSRGWHLGSSIPHHLNWKREIWEYN